jgi:peroxiredoxin
MRHLKSSLIAFSALGLAACAPGSGGPGAGAGPASIDLDNDGLPDSWEEANDLATDNADTDGDGFTDGEEVFGFSDPTDADDRLYQGGWDRAPWPSDLEEQEVGYAIGSVSPNFALPDAYGDNVGLWSFFGSVILIKNSAAWCGPCRASEEEAEERYQRFGEEGFIQITLLAEDEGYEPSEQDDLERWRDDFSLTFPVVSDEGWAVSNGYEQDGGIPTYSLIGRDMTIRTLDGSHSDGEIEQLLAEEAPEVDWEMPEEQETTDDEVPAEGVDAPEVPATTDYTPFGGTGNAEAVDATPSPYGGASCNAGGNAGSAGLMFGLLGLMGLAIRRR